MKRAMIVACLLLITSRADGVTYKWEDGKGVHYTDDFASVPEVLRKRSVPEDEDGVINFGRVVPLRNDTGAMRKKQAEIDRVNTARDRIVMEAIRQHQADVINRTNQESSDLQKRLVTMFAGSVMLWTVTLLLVAFVCLISLRDIGRSVFPSPTRKYLWLACVICLPLIGSILYYRFGRSRREGATAEGDDGSPELRAAANNGKPGNRPEGNTPAK